jgi:hypothetical protein
LTHLDPLATTKLQQWLKTKVDPFSPGIKVLLAQLHEFAWTVHRDGFDSILSNEKINSHNEKTSAIALFESIAHSMCRDVGISERAIAMKSLQETLFVCTEAELDLSSSQLGKRLGNYLELSGSKGFIRLFLSVHLSNLIFKDLHDVLQTEAVETSRNRVEAVEQLCQSAAGLSLRSWAKWPDLTQTVINSATQRATEEMKKAINQKGLIARPRP